MVIYSWIFDDVKLNRIELRSVALTSPYDPDNI